MRELLVQIQAAIDAIDRAIADEKNIASANTPPTAVGFIDPSKAVNERHTRPNPPNLS
jgi:hypothetical protein